MGNTLIADFHLCCIRKSSRPAKGRSFFMMKRVVVTGIGAVTPIGNDIGTFRKNLQAGVNGIAPITRFDTAD